MKSTRQPTYAEAQERIKHIKVDLRDLGWTRAQPESPMNHGPIHTRDKAEALYQEWLKLDNPYSIPMGTTDEYHAYWS